MGHLTYTKYLVVMVQRNVVRFIHFDLLRIVKNLTFSRTMLVFMYLKQYFCTKRVALLGCCHNRY